MAKSELPMTRRTAFCLFLGMPRNVSRAMPGQSRPDTFRVYSESPRIFLRSEADQAAARERERQSLSWEQFEFLDRERAFPGDRAGPRPCGTGREDETAGKRAVAWAAGPGTDTRQIALVADWCAPHFRCCAKSDLREAQKGIASTTAGELSARLAISVLAALALDRCASPRRPNGRFELCSKISGPASFSLA